MQTTEKTCFKCLCKLPLEAFYKHAQMGDGHLNKCKACTKIDTTTNRNAKIGYYRSYDNLRAAQPHRVAQAKRVLSEWRVAHPKRSTAHGQVARAIKSGKIIPWPCMVCGNKAVAHHPDYDRPLDVVWLCQAHHKQAHALVINNEERKAA